MRNFMRLAFFVLTYYKVVICELKFWLSLFCLKFLCLTQGIISEDDLPLYYRNKDDKTTESYECLLAGSRGFKNPNSFDALCDRLDLPMICHWSFFDSINSADFSPEKRAPHLRRIQTHSLAMKSVEKGVEKLRQDESVLAMQHFNKALQVEPDNVEALVARGALYANSKSFDLAVEDFTKALEIDVSHLNAKKYLIETLIAQCEVCRLDKKMKRCKQRAKLLLQFDPDNEYANKLLGLTTTSLSSPNYPNSDDEASPNKRSKNSNNIALDEDLRRMYAKYGLDEKIARNPDFLLTLKKYSEKFGAKRRSRKSSLDISKTAVAMTTAVSSSIESSKSRSTTTSSEGDSYSSISSSSSRCSEESNTSRTKGRKIRHKSPKFREKAEIVPKSPKKFIDKRTGNTNGRSDDVIVIGERSCDVIVIDKQSDDKGNDPGCSSSNVAKKDSSDTKLKRDLKNMEDFVNLLKKKR